MHPQRYTAVILMCSGTGRCTSDCAFTSDIIIGDLISGAESASNTGTSRHDCNGPLLIVKVLFQSSVLLSATMAWLPLTQGNQHDV